MRSTTLGSRIKQLRTKSGLSQYALAVRTGVTVTTIGNLESDKHDPRLQTLRALADALEVTPAELIEGTG